nr:hypothetical protein [Planctomycetota bacterium]
MAIPARAASTRPATGASRAGLAGSIMRIMRWLLRVSLPVALLLPMIAPSVQAATVSIGAGAVAWDYPMHTFYHDSRTQVIYLASELGAAGNISKLSLTVTGVPNNGSATPNTLFNWTIRMKQTALSSYPASPSWDSGWTVCYQADTIVSATGLVTFTFTTPFPYDGVNNLLIDFSHNDNSYSANGLVTSTTMGVNRSIYYYSDSGFGNDPLLWNGIGNGSTVPAPILSTNIPNVQLTITPALVTVGGGAIAKDFPLHAVNHDARTEAIYLASEIGVAGNITKLALNVSTIPGQVLNNFTIRMKNSPMSAFTGAPASWDQGSWTTVYQANENIAVTGWRTFTLQSQFPYDGVSNLLVDFSFDDSTLTSSGNVLTSAVAGQRMMTGFSNSTDGDPRAWSGITPATSTLASIPNVQLTFAGLSTAPASGFTNIGVGSLSYDYPLHTFYHDSRTQAIYLQSELGAAQNFTGLQLNVQTVPGQTLDNWTIRIRHTPATSYGVASWDAGPWTTVHASNATIAATGWTTFTFSAPFAYDGVNSLTIDFSHDSTFFTTNGNVFASTTGTNRVVYGFTDSGFGDPKTWTGFGGATPTLSNTLPNIRLLGAASPTIFVNAAATGANNGVNWTDAYTSLPLALDQATVAGTQIWVAAGTYKPGRPLTSALRTNTFQLANGISLYGGFFGNEGALSSRNPVVNPSILSGDIGTIGVNTDNCYHVVTAATGAVLDGFVIRDGNANSAGGFPDINGGGMLCSSASPTIANCSFTSNTASNVGGAIIFYQNSSPTVTNCVFTGNSGSLGGAMYFGVTSNPIITNCTFTLNTASSQGGAGYISSSSPVFTNDIFWSDSAPTANEMLVSGGTPSASFCDFQGGTPAGLSAGSGMIGLDPVFLSATTVANALGADGVPGTADDGLRLQGSSPCIDAGTAAGAPAADVLGIVRPKGAGYDIGAYEGRVVPVTFSSATGSGAESTTAVSIPVTITVSDGTVQVAYAVTSGTATGGGSDYTLAAGTLTFAPGVTTQNINVTVVNDFVDEVDETFAITLTPTVGAYRGAIFVYT